MGCNSEVLAVDTVRHEATCNQRRIPCGTGSDDCARQLCTWVVEGQLQVCSAHGSNPLFGAAARGDQEHHLLSYIIHSLRKDDHLTRVMDSEDWVGTTPLTTAAQRGCQTAVTLLYEIGKATVNMETSTGRTPLSEAARYGHVHVVKTLLEFGATVEMKLIRGHSALWWSKRMGNVPLEEILEREMRASIKKRSLMIAVSRGDRKTVASALMGGEAYRISHVVALESELQDAKLLMAKYVDRIRNLQEAAETCKQVPERFSRVKCIRTKITH